MLPSNSQPYSPHSLLALPNCPKCQLNDQVQPVPMAFSLGKIQLAPPEQSRTASIVAPSAIVAAAILGTLLIYAIMSLVIIALFNSLTLIAFFAVPVLVMTVLLVIVIISQVKRVRLLSMEHAQKTEEWKKALVRWQQMLYCYRDDGVFLPYGNEFESTTWMKSLLYK